jgi:hypothetical protein
LSNIQIYAANFADYQAQHGMAMQHNSSCSRLRAPPLSWIWPSSETNGLSQFVVLKKRFEGS